MGRSAALVVDIVPRRPEEDYTPRDDGAGPAPGGGMRGALAEAKINVKTASMNPDKAVLVTRKAAAMGRGGTCAYRDWDTL